MSHPDPSRDYQDDLAFCKGCMNLVFLNDDDILCESCTIEWETSQKEYKDRRGE